MPTFHFVLKKWLFLCFVWVSNLSLAFQGKAQIHSEQRRTVHVIFRTGPSWSARAQICLMIWYQGRSIRHSNTVNLGGKYSLIKYKCLNWKYPINSAIMDHHNELLLSCNEIVTEVWGVSKNLEQKQKHSEGPERGNPQLLVTIIFYGWHNVTGDIDCLSPCGSGCCK